MSEATIDESLLEINQVVLRGVKPCGDAAHELAAITGSQLVRVRTENRVDFRCRSLARLDGAHLASFPYFQGSLAKSPWLWLVRPE